MSKLAPILWRGSLLRILRRTSHGSICRTQCNARYFARDRSNEANQMQQADRGTGATETLARFVTETSYKALPADVVASAKIAIFDGIANMLAGATQPLSAILVNYLKQIGGNPQSTVVGHDFKTSAPSAA